MPIEKKSVMEMIDVILPMVINLYNTDHHRLTLDLYWFFNGKFQLFEPKSANDGTITLEIPDKLTEILTQTY